MAVLVAVLSTGLSASLRAATREEIEADWLKQAESVDRTTPAARLVATATPAGDAAGAVDGVKNGNFGFHTAAEKNPWWQVDLQTPTAVGRVVVYNRLDYAPGLGNANHLVVLSSDNGLTWTEQYRHDGKVLGGIRGQPPLTVTFKPGGIKTRFLRLQLPTEQPVFLHLDEVEVYAEGDGKTNLALGKPASQSSVSQWSTEHQPPRAVGAGKQYPTPAFVKRARRLAAQLRAAGVDTRSHEKTLDEIVAKLSPVTTNAPAVDQRALYLETRWAMRRLAFSNPLLNFDKLVFVKRFTQQTYPDVCLNHMPWVSRPGGDICLLSNWKEEGPSQVKPLLNGALGHGHVHGMDLWFDADRVVFGYAKAKSDQPVRGFPGRMGHNVRLSEEPIHIFEINADGTGLKQLTKDTLWSDLDPTYLPNGDIAFVSERCGASLQCNEMDKDETSCNLYVMRPDGTGIKRLTVTKDGDYLPHTLDDGTIAYTRWEYQERGWANVQSIWTVRPDGTGADAVFKQHFDNPWAIEETRSIPGSKKLVAIATGHHTLPAGPVIVVDTTRGLNNSAGIAIVTPGVKPPEGGMSGTPVAEGGVADAGGFYMQPWALSEQHFLVSYCYGSQTDPSGYGLYLIDVFGTKELIYRDPAISCFVPIPLRLRTKPPVLPDTTDPTKDYAVCSVANVAQGVPGVDPKKLRYLRIAEGVMWPYTRETGGERYEPDAKGTKINWTPTRVLGTVPIEADGSAHFQVPADTAVYFQLLDENQMELRRMRSFISFQPGEVRGCVGCHESREEAPHHNIRPTLALQRPASIPVPPPWGGDKAISFLRDIQPLLDRQCVSCHSGLKPAGNADLFGGLTARQNRAFDTLQARVSRSNVHQGSIVTQPMEFGSHRSPLLATLRAEAHKKRTSLTAEDWLRLVTWIDANAPYHDGFINKRANPPVYDLPNDRALATALQQLHADRCAACHKVEQVVRLDWIDVRRPENSLFLKAPLAKTVGGTGKCSEPVYKDATDPLYTNALQIVRSAVEKAWAAPRRDVKALVVEQNEKKNENRQTHHYPGNGSVAGR